MKKLTLIILVLIIFAACKKTVIYPELKRNNTETISGKTNAGGGSDTIVSDLIDTVIIDSLINE